MIITEDEAFAYCAGFFDGEGHIVCYKYQSENNYPHIRIGATNTVIAPIELLVSNFNGRIVTRDRNPKYKIQYEWVLSDLEDCGYFLQSVIPYLTVKQEKAKAALIIIDNSPKLNNDVVNSELLITINPQFQLFGGKTYKDNKKIYNHICIVCSTPFTSKKELSISCSKTCSISYRKKNWGNQYAQKSEA